MTENLLQNTSPNGVSQPAGSSSDAGSKHCAPDVPPEACVLREGDVLLQVLCESVPDLLLLVDRAGIIHFANRSMATLSRGDLLGRLASELLVPEQRLAALALLEQTAGSGQTQWLEARDVFGALWAIRAVPWPLGQADHVLLICTDVTEARHAAERVGKEQQLLRQLLELQERDRRWASYEIHDSLAQRLAGAIFHLQGFRETFARDSQQAWAMFDAALRLLGDVIDESRRMISSLRPPILDEEGLLAAVDYLVMECSKSGGIAIEFVREVQFDRLPAPLEDGLFRIIQELLINAVRHSGSDQVRIELRQSSEMLRLSVRDWGQGFDPGGAAAEQFGLQAIRERARLLSGEVTIETAPGRGAYVLVEFPLNDGFWLGRVGGGGQEK